MGLGPCGAVFPGADPNGGIFCCLSRLRIGYEGGWRSEVFVRQVHSSVSIEPGAAEGGEVALDRVANAIAGIYSEPHKLYKR